MLYGSYCAVLLGSSLSPASPRTARKVPRRNRMRAAGSGSWKAAAKWRCRSKKPKLNCSRGGGARTSGPCTRDATVDDCLRTREGCDAREAAPLLPLLAAFASDSAPGPGPTTEPAFSAEPAFPPEAFLPTVFAAFSDFCFSNDARLLTERYSLEELRLVPSREAFYKKGKEKLELFALMLGESVTVQGHFKLKSKVNYLNPNSAKLRE